MIEMLTYYLHIITDPVPFFNGMTSLMDEPERRLKDEQCVTDLD